MANILKIIIISIHIYNFQCCFYFNIISVFFLILKCSYLVSIQLTKQFLLYAMNKIYKIFCNIFLILHVVSSETVKVIDNCVYATIRKQSLCT